MNNLANSLATVGRPAEALELREKTLALRQAHLGVDHPDTMMSLSNLGQSHYLAGRFADALPLHQKALTLRKAKLGGDHPDTLRSMAHLAATLGKLDRSEQAIAIADECFHRAARKPVDSWILPQCIHVRIRAYQKQGDAAGCRDTAAMWEELGRSDRDSLYHAAQLRAITAAVARNVRPPSTQADADADWAMGWLQKAAAAGFNDSRRLEKDPDLAALRRRADFQKFVASLAAAKKS
jgi:tetratricopeptide (TPR) repeat protein